LKEYYKPNLYLALAHYPVVNKNGDIIASAVTNLDLHDISRAAKTYGVRRFFVVTPLEDQRALVKKIVSHWTMGVGAEYNALRKDALELIHTEGSLKEVVDHIKRLGDGSPKTVMTCARSFARNISYSRFREILKNGGSYLLVFGTAWGLADSLLTSAEYILEPIRGNTDYNHLSVRSAVSVILDRLLAH